MERDGGTAIPAGPPRGGPAAASRTAAPARAPLSGPVVHLQLWEALANHLRQEILTGVLPQGTKLVESDLAARFGVSRGPVRDALRELGRLGLTLDIPRRGTFVSSTTEADLEEVLVAREAVEGAAIRLAIRRATDGDLRDLERGLDGIDAAYAAGDIGHAWEADLDWHRGILVVAGNGRLLAIFEQLAALTILLMQSAADPAVRIAPPPLLHRSIAAGLIARDEPAAREALACHFRFTGDRLFTSADAYAAAPGGRS